MEIKESDNAKKLNLQKNRSNLENKSENLKEKNNYQEVVASINKNKEDISINSDLKLDYSLTKISKINSDESFKNIKASKENSQNTQYFTHNYTQIGKFRDKIPKLVIIIDDVASYEHINEIKKINLKLTPSLMPASSDFPNTPKIAKNLEFYMIHLPLEALNYNSNSIKTLKTNDSFEEISKEIYKIRKDFPNAKFINNHTGSKFTSNKKAVIKLLNALDKYGFIFIDSKTISNSKVEEVLKSKNQKYIFRDVFLDNTQNLKDNLKMNANKLSGGQKQRLCIARMLTTNPKILIFDEPCSSLDLQNTLAIENLLKNLSQNYTIIISTHNTDQAKRISDRILFIEDKKLIEQDEI